MHFTTATVLAILSASAEAAQGKSTFAVNRFYGKGPLLTARMDPIVNSGAPSTHVHSIQGGNAFALDMTDDQPLKSTCTSSRAKNDKSNYWTPQLYFQDPKDGKLTSVDMYYMNVYYFFEASEEEVHPFPTGLRIFSGDSSLRTPPASPSNILDASKGTPQPVQWTCTRSEAAKIIPLFPPGSDGLHGVGIQDPGNAGQGVGFPDKECDGFASPLRADIHFPSCYNPAKGLRNYKENMEWPTNGKCPTGYTHVPHLFYEVYWDTLKFKGQWTPGQGKSPWVLSNGDPTGYSLHGDFIAGWDEATLQQVVDNCNAGDSGMDKCPGLIGGLNDPSTTCNIESPIKENVIGTMDVLPGGNAVGKWGVAAAGPQVSSPTYLSPAGTGGASSAVVVPAPSVEQIVPSPTLSEAPGSNAASSVISTPAQVKTPVANPLASTATPNALDGSEPPNIMLTSYISETTTFWTTVKASGSAPTSSAGPGASASTVAEGWTYKGCFSDDRDNRVLSGITFADVGQHAVTNTKCVAYCEEKKFSMAGTEFGGQCFCGNEMVGSESLTEDKCTMACEGDGSQMCGGGLALSVYSKGSKKAKRVSRHLHRHPARRSS